MTGHLTWIGTATTLLEYGGFTVLTDPNFLHRGERAYLGKGLWSKRSSEPSLQVGELPPLDAVVLSHLHGDHFDRRARHGLPKDTLIVTTRQAARRLRLWGFVNAVALGTWDSHELARSDGSRLTVTAAPGRHAPGVLQGLLPPVMGSVLSYAPTGDDVPLEVYLTGDTLMHDDLREVPQRHPHLDVGLWHLGGTRIPGAFGLGLLVTMDGRQGADLLELVRPQRTVPIHHGDYPVFRSPVTDFLAEVEQRGLTGVRPVERGQRLPLPPP
ncbi:MAG: MBL fold metallo-hydrolase [Actinobacteria bacterium]|nr:MBL fold metallo-hydrolase [Actinomycetota bacterium]MBW3646558.1 MBL fold metallo-hydrolase [Actinomycetota bacterium]